jgi:hypothetical protein
MDHNQNIEARELHRTLEFIGLRAQATSVGLIQLCAELVRAHVLDDAAIQRIKDAIYGEITVSHGRGRSREEFEALLRQRLDAIFPRPQDDARRTPVGTVGEMETALDPNAPSHSGTKD